MQGIDSVYASRLMKRLGLRTIESIEKLACLLPSYCFENPGDSISPWEPGKLNVAGNFPARLDGSLYLNTLLRFGAGGRLCIPM